MARKNKALNETMACHDVSHSSASVDGLNYGAFSDRVQALVDAFGSVAELARKCGSSESVVRKWRDGVSDPSRDRCLALARGTGASLIWLVSGVEPMWDKDLSPEARDTQTIALGDSKSVEVRNAWLRRDAAIKAWSAGVAENSVANSYALTHAPADYSWLAFSADPLHKAQLHGFNDGYAAAEAAHRSQRRASPETLPGEASQPMRRESLTIALQLASEALGKKVLPPAKHAELVTLIYELLEEGLHEAKVLRFARAFVA